MPFLFFLPLLPLFLKLSLLISVWSIKLVSWTTRHLDNVKEGEGGRAHSFGGGSTEGKKEEIPKGSRFEIEAQFILLAALYKGELEWFKNRVHTSYSLALHCLISVREEKLLESMF